MPLFDRVYICEGCGERRERFLPLTWWQCGTSRLDGKSLALWCQGCVDNGTMSREARGPAQCQVSSPTVDGLPIRT